MVTKVVDKPTFTRDQLIPSAVASKNFGKIRKQAQVSPQYITDNGVVNTVVMGYEQFESMYQRLRELEDREEARLLENRMERLEKNPETTVPWRKVQRTGGSDG